MSMAKFESKYPPSGKDSPVIIQKEFQTFFGKKRQKINF